LTCPRVAAQNHPDDAGKQDRYQRTPYLQQVDGVGPAQNHRGANDDEETHPTTNCEGLTASEDSEGRLFGSMAKAPTDPHSSCDSNDRSARESIGRSKVDLIEHDAVTDSKV
jgi:hypothetical protein